jgi:hypothetical protein
MLLVVAKANEQNCIPSFDVSLARLPEKGGISFDVFWHGIDANFRVERNNVPFLIQFNGKRNKS